MKKQRAKEATKPKISRVDAKFHERFSVASSRNQQHISIIAPYKNQEE
jgi:hypothetical protein